MTPATEARLLALATALGMESPRITVRPTTGEGSKSWRKGYDATARGTEAQSGPSYGSTENGSTEGGAIAKLEAKLVSRLRDTIAHHREIAAWRTAAADRLEAALTAALATPEHATLPAPVCPSPTGAP